MWQVFVAHSFSMLFFYEFAMFSRCHAGAALYLVHLSGPDATSRPFSNFTSAGVSRGVPGMKSWKAGSPKRAMFIMTYLAITCRSHHWKYMKILKSEKSHNCGEKNASAIRDLMIYRDIMWYCNTLQVVRCHSDHLHFPTPLHLVDLGNLRQCCSNLGPRDALHTGAVSKGKSHPPTSRDPADVRVRSGPELLHNQSS